MDRDQSGQFVDYGRDAGRYHRHRRLHGARLDVWRAALSRCGVSTARHVLDLGCGTGVFSGALADWTGGTVIGFDPSPTMLAELSAPEVLRVQGDGARLPVRSASLDLVWMSAVLHHVTERTALAAELGRVVAPHGAVAIRGLFRDRPDGVPWLAAFPEAARARAVARFPATSEVVDLLGPANLQAVEIIDVEEGATTPSEAVQFITAMRDRDTLLTAMTDAEIAGAVQSLARWPESPLPFQLTLMVFRRPAPAAPREFGSQTARAG